VLEIAHSVKFILFVDASRQDFVAIFAVPIWVEREIKLLVPVEGVAGAAELVVTGAGASTVAGDVGGVNGYLGGDQAGRPSFGFGCPGATRGSLGRASPGRTSRPLRRRWRL
jgi:hypothetical protein